jgi:Zn-dependent M28 family amino/carboxypeptidase
MRFFTHWKKTVCLLFLAALASCNAVGGGNAPTSVLPSPLDETRTSAPVSTVMLTYTPAVPEFDGQRAFEDVKTQISFGPRLPGSQAHSKAVEWIKEELSSSGWSVEMQETTYHSQDVRNVIAKRGTGKSPWLIIGAHYDSRMKADRDPLPENRDQPVPGANDGASGIAVLLELARRLPKDLDKQVWLLFIDAEDQGKLPGWDWIYGSRAFAESLSTKPDAVVIIDMIGDADLNIKKERSSSPELVTEIWNIAVQRGHSEFQAQEGYSMIDDHTPFLQQGIPAIDIIDFDYRYWHTIADTTDKVSPASLYAVGDTLLYWLMANE